MDAAALEPHQVPLSGVHLVEASAGTGKTWTLSAIYLRLVVEAELAPSQILVVTFTNAATAELSARIRRRLLDAQAAFAGEECGDAFAADLAARHPQRERALARLRLALLELDLAAVHTIHGFCQRALAESAFEGGLPFECELLPDESALLAEVVRDFWRRETASASPLWVQRLERAGGVEALAKLLGPLLARPPLALAAPGEEDDAPLEAAFVAAWEAARALWLEDGARAHGLLAQSPALARNRLTPARIAEWQAQMRVIAATAPALPLPEGLNWGASGFLAGAVKKDQTAPEHPLFDACQRLKKAAEALEAAQDRRLGALRARALAFCREALAARKGERRQQSYHDLLDRLHSALAGPAGEALAASLRRRYRAALIDEFQDTDSLQFDIFRRVWGDGGPLYLVGDPKQAIYAFRGADVFTYLDARRAADAGWFLERNRRSTPLLVDAVNALFGLHPDPFLLPELKFRPAQAAAEAPPLEEPGAGAAPLRLWFVPRREGQKTVAKGEAEPRVAAAVAAEAARLLGLGARGELRVAVRDGDPRPLAGGDMAVLVRTHRQGELVRDALARLGVASVQQGQRSVFETREARELLRLLAAVLEPGRASLVRAALATDLLGLGGEALAALAGDDRGWESWVERLREDLRRWRQHGFMAMLAGLMARESVARRLLDHADGERRLTNLLHLAELLQQAAHAERLAPEALARRLAQRIADPGSGEEMLLRLESDEHLVRILTIHKSKGLEYPVVFCPFLSDAPKAGDGALVYHDGGRLTADLAEPPGEAALAQARREAQAESLRLAYVALTRAKQRCYVVWGGFNESEGSPLARLLLGADVPPMAELDDAALRAAARAWSRAAPGALRIEDMPEEPGARFVAAREDAAAPAARPLLRRPPQPWRVTSFTALSAGMEPEHPDHDALAGGEAAGEGFFAFPRGPHAGTCLHELFERLDFAAGDDAVAALAGRVLARHGIGAEWVRPAAAMVRRVLEAELDPGSGLRLAAVARRVPELGFWYPLRGLDQPALSRVLAAHGAPAGLRRRVEGMELAPQHGYMRGFIDLVFEHGGRWWLLDWKSNWLGPDWDDYAPQRLEEAMAREAYHLQYLVYCVALHRLLRLRLPGYDYERHFGGALYLFLRGVDPARPGCGVFRDRPARALVEALDALFAGSEAAR